MHGMRDACASANGGKGRGRKGGRGRGGVGAYPVDLNGEHDGRHHAQHHERRDHLAVDLRALDCASRRAVGSGGILVYDLLPIVLPLHGEGGKVGRARRRGVPLDRVVTHVILRKRRRGGGGGAWVGGLVLHARVCVCACVCVCVHACTSDALAPLPMVRSKASLPVLEVVLHRRRRVVDRGVGTHFTSLFCLPPSVLVFSTTRL